MLRVNATLTSSDELARYYCRDRQQEEFYLDTYTKVIHVSIPLKPDRYTCSLRTGQLRNYIHLPQGEPTALSRRHDRIYYQRPQTILASLPYTRGNAALKVVGGLRHQQVSTAVDPRSASVARGKRRHGPFGPASCGILSTSLPRYRNTYGYHRVL